MARTSILAAGVLSLALVGTSGSALAQQATDSSAGKQQGVYRIFGKTLCSADAAAEVECDWRLPRLDGDAAASPTTPGLTSFKLLGQWYCVGEMATGRCDVPLRAEPEPRTKRSFRIFGLNVCLGEATASAGCDVAVPAAPEESDRRASL